MTRAPREPSKASLLRRIAALEEEVRLLQQPKDDRSLPKDNLRDVVYSYYGEVEPNEHSGAHVVKDFNSMIRRVIIVVSPDGVSG